MIRPRSGDELSRWLGRGPGRVLKAMTKEEIRVMGDALEVRAFEDEG